MKRTRLEAIKIEDNASVNIIINPKLYDFYYWHFHPEIELVFIQTETGNRHVGDHKSKFYGSDLVLIGSDIPHLNFDYGVKTDCEKIVIQFHKDLTNIQIPEFLAIRELFQMANYGVSFSKNIQEQVKGLLWKLPYLNNFDRLQLLLNIFHLLAHDSDKILLHTKPYINQFIAKDQKRIRAIYAFIEENFDKKITIETIAKVANLSNEAFCRYFKKVTKLTFTDFLNHYRIDQAKELISQQFPIASIAYECGFESPSYFHRTFKKIVGMSPKKFGEK